MNNRIHERIQKIRARFATAQIDTLMVSIQENRRYLSGFTGDDGQFDETAGALFIKSDQLLLATDGRYTLQANTEAPDYHVVTYDKGLPQALPGILADLNAKDVGFEAARLPVAHFEKIQDLIRKAGLNTNLIPTVDLIESLRIIKDSEEIEHTRQALAFAETAYTDLLPTLRAGMTEREVAWDFEQRIREVCPEGLSFSVIVAAGPNSALPHAIPGNRKIKPAEPILFDWGARVEGYCSDTSRTVILGPPEKKFVTVYQEVQRAQEKAIAAIRPGISGQAVDAIARSHIEAAGFGDKFNHGLGHGTGLAIHEKPRLGPTSDSVLAPGMICTVEPGIYIPGWGGVRLENQVVVTEDGVEVLTHLGLDDYVI